MADKTSNEELLRKFLDGELSSEQERQALHMIADDDEARAMLSFDRTFYQSFGREPGPGPFHVPDGFADDVMSQVVSTEAASPVITFWGKIKEFYNVLLSPRPVVIRPAFTVMVVLTMMVIMALPYIGKQNPDMTSQTHVTSAGLIAEQEEQAWIRFVYFDDQAESMAVAGDFSDWDPISLTKERVGDEQVWTGLIPVTKKEQRYMFVKDGEQWVTDPLAQVQQDDGFGNKNAVLFL
ncbi:MAG: hypothetical protein WD038_06360 [Balneolales bacterium]